MRPRQQWEIERDRGELLGRLRDAVWDTFLKQGKTPASIRELHDSLGLAIEEVMEDYDEDDTEPGSRATPPDAGEAD